MGTKSTTKIDKTIGKQVKSLRIAKGMTRQDLGELIKITHQQLQKDEEAINRFSASRLHAVSKALGAPVSYFFDDDNAGDINDARMCVETLRDFSKLSLEKKQAVRGIIKSLTED